jgi:hypothetical protein
MPSRSHWRSPKIPMSKIGEGSTTWYDRKDMPSERVGSRQSRLGLLRRETKNPNYLLQEIPEGGLKLRPPTEEETKTDTEASKSPVRGDSFTKPRLDLWTRNDDIEYDWGDSEEEL